MPFDDHNAPPFELIYDFCEDAVSEISHIGTVDSEGPQECGGSPLQSRQRKDRGDDCLSAFVVESGRVRKLGVGVLCSDEDIQL